MSSWARPDSVGPMDSFFKRLVSTVLTKLYGATKDVPVVKRRVEGELQEILAGADKGLRPYRGEVETFRSIPPSGRDREEVLAEMTRLQDQETGRWRDGFVSGAVYHGDREHVEFLNRVYALHSQVNPLHSDLWPSGVKYEAEVVSMTARMLGAPEDAAPEDEVCGVVSSGGTESILLAMKTYRDLAREERGVVSGEIVVPETAHAAFDKAAQYFGLRLVKVPVGEDGRADVDAARAAIGRNTVAVVGSAPSYPHGAIDPIEELSEAARARGVPFHTDACLGGFVLPWAEKLGYPVPPFDFRLPGVTSMSADTHKYGYAAKGTSVVLYRGRKLRRHQYYTAADWPGGLYFSPTFAGSRPGALSAAAWAALVSTGEDGYLDATRRILETARAIREGIGQIPGLEVLGEPLWVIAVTSKEIDVYKVLDLMSARRWNLNGLQRPPAFHIAVTLRHTEPGVVERFLDDLRAAAEGARGGESVDGGMAPVYGMASKLPVRGLVHEVLRRYIDKLYEP